MRLRIAADEVDTGRGGRRHPAALRGEPSALAGHVTCLADVVAVHAATTVALAVHAAHDRQAPLLLLIRVKRVVQREPGVAHLIVRCLGLPPHLLPTL